MREASRGPRLLQLLGRIVPRARRDDWYAEWTAEFTHALIPRRGSRFARTRRTLDAAEDALRLRLGIERPGGLSPRALAQDVRYGVRSLAHRPGYSLGVIFTLALGIGANTAIFSVVSGVLFHRLPYADPESLVILWGDASRRGLGLRAGQPPADFLEWQTATSSFEGMAALRNSSLGFTELEEPLVPLTHMVSPDYFDVLGVEAERGRTFGPDDADGRRVVIVSHTLWQRALEADPDIVGRTLVLDNEPWVVVGVLPPDFYTTHQLPVQPDLWIPLSFEGQQTNRTDRRHAVFARLRPGVSATQAQREMSTIAARLEAEHPETHTDWDVAVVPVMENAVGAYRQTFRVLLLAVALVLLIAAANVTNLTLAQATERSREVALRAALGAGRVRLVRQLLAESVLLAMSGGVVGVTLAYWGTPLLLRLIPGATDGSTTVGGVAAVPFLDQVSLDLRVLGFAFVLTLVTGVVSGLVPARQASRGDLDAALRDGGRGAAGGRRSGRLRGGLVVAEVAISLVLLVGAGLLLQSFWNQRDAELGYDADKVLTLRNSLRIGPDQQLWLAHFREAAARLTALPGVELASAVSFVPPEFSNRTIRFHRPGSGADPERDPIAVPRIVLPDYFKTMGIRVLEGRVIDDRDAADSAPVVVVNEEFQRLHFPDEGAMGEHIVPELDGAVATLAREQHDTEWRIIGVVGNVRSAGTDPRPQAMVYVPATQVPRPIMNIVVRTREPAAGMLRPAERELWKLGRDMNVYSVETLERRLGNLMWQSRLSMQLLGLFALLALVLGAAGIYAVLTYSVSRRIREVGVRVALGADRSDVLRLVIGGGLRLTVLGIAIGGLTSLLLMRLLQGFLYGITPGDPLTLAGVATVILVVAISACALPGIRAARVDPIAALKID